MSPRPPMRSRTIKVRDDLWNAALAAAEQRQEVLSEEVRKFLERYVAQSDEYPNTGGAVWFTNPRVNDDKEQQR